MDNVYSAFHYHKKCKEDREAVEALLPEIKETAEKAVFGNIGDIKYTTRTTVPNGGYWCDGQTIAKSELEAVYQMLVDGKLVCVDIETYNNVVSLNGSCGFFGLDTASEAFRVPLLDEIYIKAGQVADEFGAESLPNITGEFGGGQLMRTDVGAAASGAFKLKSGYQSSRPTGEGGSTYAIDIDASRSSAVYQNGAKVNPDHVTYRAYVILYTAVKEFNIVDYTNRLEGTTQTGLASLTSKTQEGVNTLNSKTLSGISDLANASNALRTTQITNCITEIPQDIKLELNNGVISAKAGSKIRYPDGKNEDGSLRFGEIVLESDLSINYKTDGKMTLYYNVDNNTLIRYLTESEKSGGATPTEPTTWYDTDNNILRRYDAGGAIGVRLSLPLCHYTVSSDVVSSIDQVFNGFGYIGSTVFALPGVKGLIPNDRNEDGSLRNIETVINKVLTFTRNSNYSGLELTFTDNALALYAKQYEVDVLPSTAISGQIVYLKPENQKYSYDNGWVKTHNCSAAVFDKTDKGVENFTPKLPFRAVDANDDSIDYIVERYNSGTNWYRVYKSGWVEQGGLVNVSGNATVTFLKPFQNANYIISAQALTNSTSDKSNFSSAIINKTSTSVLIRTRWSSENGVGDATCDCWHACGQGA